MSQITWSPDLILRIIGTCIAGVGLITVYIMVRRFLREKPKLKIEVLECIYELIRPTPAEKMTRLSIEFNVGNTGDRGTQLKSLDVSFQFNDKLYEKSQSLITEGTFPEDTFVGANQYKPLRTNFFFKELSIEQPVDLDFNFTLYHTHNKVKFLAKHLIPNLLSLKI